MCRKFDEKWNKLKSDCKILMKESIKFDVTWCTIVVPIKTDQFKIQKEIIRLVLPHKKSVCNS